MIELTKKEVEIADAPVKIKPAVDLEILTDILPGVLEDGHIYVHCHCKNAGDDLLVRIWRTTYLIDTTSGAKNQLIHAENITMAPQWTLVPSHATHNFLLIFGSLHSSCKSFDLVEEITQPGGFEVRGIKRNDADVYHIHLL